jgi:hypothetical protein
MSAVVLQLPAKTQRAAQRRMNRVDIEARYRWVRNHSEKWETTEVDGAEAEEYLNPRCRQLLKILDDKWGAIKGPTMKEMRQRIAESRSMIVKRNQVKVWLESLGADLDAFGAVNPAERALFFVFDQLHRK